MLKPMVFKAGCVAVLCSSLVSCSNLPGSSGEQGAVVGGVSGAAAGAAVGGEKHRVLGALLGGALGAGGGYVIGANVDKIGNKDKQSATTASQNAQSHPATVQDALNSNTADLNHDGFVTLDEVVAMKDAGFSDQKMLDRMRATDQVFELTDEQKKYLTDHGVSANVIDQMATINHDKKAKISSTPPDSVISQPAPK